MILLSGFIFQHIHPMQTLEKVWSPQKMPEPAHVSITLQAHILSEMEFRHFMQYLRILRPRTGSVASSKKLKRVLNRCLPTLSHKTKWQITLRLG